MQGNLGCPSFFWTMQLLLTKSVHFLKSLLTLFPQFWWFILLIGLGQYQQQHPAGHTGGVSRGKICGCGCCHFKTEIVTEQKSNYYRMSAGRMLLFQIWVNLRYGNFLELSENQLNWCLIKFLWLLGRLNRTAVQKAVNIWAKIRKLYLFNSFPWQPTFFPNRSALTNIPLTIWLSRLNELTG